MTTAATDFAPVLERVAAYIEARLPRAHAPGVVVGLTDRNGVLGVVARGWADLAGRRAVTDGDRFQIGSISKSFAAIIALQEQERGSLDLHAPVTDCVPWFRVRSRFAPITLHHLLTHTSGLPEGTDVSLDAHHEVWLLRDFDCRYAPGERFLYSNDGYKLVGIALEEVTGTPFPRLLAERLLRPLGMADSEPEIALATRMTAVKPHLRLFEDRPWHAGQPLVEAPWYETASADGSIVSTVADMCAYARLLLGRGATPAGGLLSDQSFALLTGRHVPDRDADGVAWYGYGLATLEADGRELVGHSGGMVGFSSYLMMDPAAGLAVVVLMNGNEPREELVRYALAAGRAAVAGQVLPEPPPPAEPTLIGEPAGEYAGLYPLGGDVAAGDPLLGRSLTLVAADGRLVLRDAAAGDVALERAEGQPDVFLVPHPELDRFCLRFWRDPDGRIAHATYGGAWYAGPGYAGPAAFAPVPGAAALCGHYHSWSAWMGHLRVVERRGALWLIAPWVEAAACELELVPLGEGRYRVGTEDWRLDILTIDTILGGKATRAVYDVLPFYRASTP